jgi:RimJ/RimL family protein N-acetyltransferase
VASATTGLHKGSIVCNQLRQQTISDLALRHLFQRSRARRGSESGESIEEVTARFHVSVRPAGSARIRLMRCALRELRDEDLAVLFEQWADPVAVHMAAFTAPDHMDRVAFERRWSRPRADETVINRAIVVDGEVAGTIGSWGDPDEGEVTYWIGRSYWGKGIVTCALKVFLTVDPSRPLHARVASDNVASRRVLVKCGFRVIATERGFAEARSGEIEELVLRLEQPRPVRDQELGGAG